MNHISNVIYLNNEWSIFWASLKGLFSILDILDKYITVIHWGIAQLCTMLAAK